MIPKVSVVCPIYKAEKYLDRCLESIKSQTLEDFEVILIDDGSPDKSGQICDTYSEKDRRFKVYHIENHGVSYARQYGVDHAAGEYVIHADPDDWMEKEHLEKMYAEAVITGADIVISDYWVDVHGKSRYRSESKLLNATSCNDIIEDFIGGGLFGALWNKLIRRNTIEVYNIKFPEGYIIWEDLYYVCKLLQNNITWTYMQTAYYHYDCTINNSSLVRTVTKKSIICQKEFVSAFEQYCTQNNMNEALTERKYGIKESAFTCNDLNSKEKRNVYSYLNRLYIKKNILNVKQPKKFAVSLFLLGFPNRLTILIDRGLSYLFR